MIGSACGTLEEECLHSVLSKVLLEVFLMPGYAWYLWGYLVDSILLVRPLWDYLPTTALVWVAL